MIEKIKKIIAFAKTKKGKPIFFFGFYFVFFICLFLFMNSVDYVPNDDKSNNNSEEEQNTGLTSEHYYETNNLENSDYLYKITIQKNNELEILEGSKSNQESILNYEYFNFVDLNEIKRIVKNAKYLSKSLYSEDTYKVNYEIKTSSLYELMDREKEDEGINNITLTTKENNDLIGIELDFSNYFISLNQDVSVYKVLIEYEY